MSLLEILEDKSYTYTIDYGNPNGRIETYDIDSENYYGYDSSGNYVYRPISELDHKFIQCIYKCSVLYRRM